MKYLATKIHWIGILMLAGFTTAAAALYFDIPSRSRTPSNATQAASPAVQAAPENAPAPEAQQDSCCASEKPQAKPTLPAGHPPVEGYTVESGCSHGAGHTCNHP